MVKIGLLLLILAITTGIAWLLRGGRRRQRLTRTSPQEPARKGRAGQLEALRRNRNYWGVEIHAGTCRVAKTLSGKQFPFHDAPPLPLEGCEAGTCTCTYLGLRERRNWHRRAQPDRRRMIRYLQHHPDRRSYKERRRVDVWRTLRE